MASFFLKSDTTFIKNTGAVDFVREFLKFIDIKSSTYLNKNPKLFVQTDRHF